SDQLSEEESRTKRAKGPLLLLVVRTRLLGFSLRLNLLVLLVGQIDDVQTCLSHVDNAPLSVPEPDGRIGIERVGGCVVMNRDTVEDRTGWHERLVAVFVEVLGVPAEIEAVD